MKPSSKNRYFWTWVQVGQRFMRKAIEELISMFTRLEDAVYKQNYDPPSAKRTSKEATSQLALSRYATVVIPALNEASRIASVVAYALADVATKEVIVVDDSSIDDTASLAAQAGAEVITSTMLGKGASMQDGMRASECNFLVYLDGDLSGLRPGIVSALCAPLQNGEADFVKARFGRGGGRVTELTAKPMLKIFFPDLAIFDQPLGGLIAARRDLLQNLSFEDGYGVDVGLLIDAHMAGAKLAQVDIGTLDHDSQPLHDLTHMANEIGRVIFNRAQLAGRLHVDQVTAMYESQRQAAAEIEYVMTRRRGRKRLLLLDMDGTVTPSQFVVELAKETGRQGDLNQLLASDDDPSILRDEKIANLFHYVHRKKFEQVALALEIRSGVVEFVKQMRRRGFMVGVVCNTYFVAADIIRRRIFADFAVAHTVSFQSDICTGLLRINPAFMSAKSAKNSEYCKSNVLRHFLEDPAIPGVTLTWAIGDDMDDLEMFRLADFAFAIQPKAQLLQTDSHITTIQSFQALTATLPNHEFVT